MEILARVTLFSYLLITLKYSHYSTKKSEWPLLLFKGIGCRDVERLLTRIKKSVRHNATLFTVSLLLFPASVIKGQWRGKGGGSQVDP